MEGENVKQRKDELYLKIKNIRKRMLVQRDFKEEFIHKMNIIDINKELKILQTYNNKK
jgi:hypothetical protein